MGNHVFALSHVSAHKRIIYFYLVQEVELLVYSHLYPEAKETKSKTMVGAAESNFTLIAFLFSTAVLCLCWYLFALDAARRGSWEWTVADNAWKHQARAVQSKEPLRNEPYQKKLLWWLPSVNSEPQPNHHITLAHKPIYLWRLLVFFMIQTPHFFLLRLYCFLFPTKEGCDRISDKQVFDFVTKTSLFLGAELSKDGSELSIALPRDTGNRFHFKAGSSCGSQTEGLEIVFDAQTGSILQARGGNGMPVVQDTSGYSRNAQLTSSLSVLWATIIHPASHVASESVALEIGVKKIVELEPSTRFVHALHEGLFHHYFSPIVGNTCLNLVPGDKWCSGTTGIRINVKNHPVPPHNLDERKAALSPTFLFWQKCHPIFFNLVRKHSFDVNPETLFQNIVVHSVDHCMTYEALKPMDALFGFQGTHTWLDLFRGFVFVNFWMLPIENVFDSHRVRNMKHPFYQDLYAKAREVDPYFADKMVVSCSF